ncbi:hypothetical protein G6O67_000744 [Ophiocordyceps sinensis]|uniref:Myb-like domain-containing protein n=2 Tax=Ophiocordyceps sinensis TaxID=72228 RepID=A0A8H4PZQ8_9HYPO|nr:hypothetical protein OCS_00846 [Ophiocordyceps sinensis CO18]KAF4513477.1 hypothetical protein G6O67_000744 [Ophiocordyceps sinensis]
MSETEMTPTKPMAWTEEAKTQFLLRIIAQLRGDGKSINWTRLQMEGRTTKSLQNQWFKITKEIAEMESAENGENGASTPTKPKATPRKARAKKADKSDTLVVPRASDDDEGSVEVKVTPRKRGPAARRGGGKSPAKRVKKSESDNEEPNKEVQDNGDDTAKED